MELYKLSDIDNEQYYQVPKSLFTNPFYRDISLSSKMAYAFLKDRMGLSRKNGWHDDNGDIFLYFSQQDMSEALNVSLRTIATVFKELQKVGLIKTVRQGLGMPNKIYIAKCIANPKYLHINSATIAFQKCNDCISEVQNLHSNKTDINNTEFSNTENIYSSSTKVDVCINPPYPPKEKSKDEEIDYFEKFWKEYPRKVGKGAARKSFLKLKPNNELLNKMLTALAKQKRTEQWTRDNGKYIPHPATWLNQERWDDEVSIADNSQYQPTRQRTNRAASREDEFAAMYEQIKKERLQNE